MVEWSAVLVILLLVVAGQCMWLLYMNVSDSIRDIISPLPVTAKCEVTKPSFWATDAISPVSLWTRGILMGSRGRKWLTDDPQSVAKLTVTKLWKQPESRIQNIYIYTNT